MNSAEESKSKALEIVCQGCGEKISVLAKPGAIITCESCGVQNVISEISMGPFGNLRVRSLIFWFAMGMAIVSVAGLLLKALNLEGLSEYLWFVMFHVIVYVWIIQKSKRSGISVARIMGSLPDGYRWLPVISYVIPLILFSVGIGRTTYYLLSLISPSFAGDWFAGEEFSLFHALFLITVVPFVEELFFRGILINRLTVKWDIKRAVLLSALIFAILHRNVIGAFAYGFALAVIYVQTRALIVSIVCHILINGTALGVGVIWSVFHLPALDGPFYSGPWFGLLCLLPSAPWMIYFMRKNWPRRDWKAPYFT